MLSILRYPCHLSGNEMPWLSDILVSGLAAQEHFNVISLRQNVLSTQPLTVFLEKSTDLVRKKL